jgi:hypothetical protein
MVTSPTPAKWSELHSNDEAWRLELIGDISRAILFPIPFKVPDRLRPAFEKFN